jgi:hypothetical protein
MQKYIRNPLENQTGKKTRRKQQKTQTLNKKKKKL